MASGPKTKKKHINYNKKGQAKQKRNKTTTAKKQKKRVLENV